MNKIVCSSEYRWISKYISGFCAVGIAILAIIIVAQIIPNDTFIICEIWGFGVNRYGVIILCGILTYFPAYFLVKCFWCRRCPKPPEPPEKTEERYGFPYIVDGG